MAAIIVISARIANITPTQQNVSRGNINNNINNKILRIEKNMKNDKNVIFEKK